jgi:hypothetical protein
MNNLGKTCLACALGGIALCGAVSWTALPSTANERFEADVGREAAFTRRRFFFGHTEMSDVLQGLAILSHSVDAFANAPAIRVDPTHIVRKRLVAALEGLPTLARRRIGMSEAYTLPAMYFLFEEDDPRASFDVIRWGVEDPRVNAQVPLLAGFVAHVFLADVPAAAGYYERLAQREGVPAWVGDLARKLARGEDPFVTNPKVRDRLCSVIAKSFPRAASYLRHHRTECADAIDTPGGSSP